MVYILSALNHHEDLNHKTTDMTTELFEEDVVSPKGRTTTFHHRFGEIVMHSLLLQLIIFVGLVCDQDNVKNL